MPASDFLTNVETAWLKVINANSILNKYNWQRWDSDIEVKLPRGTVSVSSRIDPEESAYHRVQTTFTFEGRPKKQKLSVVVNEFKTLLETLDASDLDAASGNTIHIIGKANVVSEDRRVIAGLRVWSYSFVLYAVPMV
jgi:hypothetical protein